MHKGTKQTEKLPIGNEHSLSVNWPQVHNKSRKWIGYPHYTLLFHTHNGTLSFLIHLQFQCAGSLAEIDWFSGSCSGVWILLVVVSVSGEPRRGGGGRIRVYDSNRRMSRPGAAEGEAAMQRPLAPFIAGPAEEWILKVSFFPRHVLHGNVTHSLTAVRDKITRWKKCLFVWSPT